MTGKSTPLPFKTKTLSACSPFTRAPDLTRATVWICFWVVVGSELWFYLCPKPGCVIWAFRPFTVWVCSKGSGVRSTSSDGITGGKSAPGSGQRSQRSKRRLCGSLICCASWFCCGAELCPWGAWGRRRWWEGPTGGWRGRAYWNSSACPRARPGPL